MRVYLATALYSWSPTDVRCYFHPLQLKERRCSCTGFRYANFSRAPTISGRLQVCCGKFPGPSAVDKIPKANWCFNGGNLHEPVALHRALMVEIRRPRHRYRASRKCRLLLQSTSFSILVTVPCWCQRAANSRVVKYLPVRSRDLVPRSTQNTKAFSYSWGHSHGRIDGTLVRRPLDS